MNKVRRSAWRKARAAWRGSSGRRGSGSSTTGTRPGPTSAGGDRGCHRAGRLELAGARRSGLARGEADDGIGPLPLKSGMKLHWASEFSPSPPAEGGEGRGRGGPFFLENPLSPTLSPTRASRGEGEESRSTPRLIQRQRRRSPSSVQPARLLRALQNCSRHRAGARGAVAQHLVRRDRDSPRVRRACARASAK